MELVKVNITVQAITARYGTLSIGDSVRTDAAYAKHLVEDCMCGEYAKPFDAKAASDASVAKAPERAKRTRA